MYPIPQTKYPQPGTVFSPLPLLLIRSPNLTMAGLQNSQHLPRPGYKDNKIFSQLILMIIQPSPFPNGNQVRQSFTDQLAPVIFKLLDK